MMLVRTSPLAKADAQSVSIMLKLVITTGLIASLMAISYAARGTPLALRVMQTAGATQSGGGYYSIVTPSEARFAFPLGGRREWQWHLRSTPDNGREYQWSIEIENHGRRYQFGFFLFKPLGVLPADGGLRSLIEAGQGNVAIASASGWVIVPAAAVHIASQNDQLFVVVNDSTTLDLLFSDHPQAAVVRIQVPGEATVTRTIKIAYGS
jgi:hypothetical protein